MKKEITKNKVIKKRKLPKMKAEGKQELDEIRRIFGD